EGQGRLALRALHQRGDGTLVDGDARDAERGAVPEEDLGERLADDGLDALTPAHDRLRCVLARRAAAEGAVHEQDARAREARIVERVEAPARLLLRAIVLERVLAEAVEHDAAEKAGGDDAVGVDVVSAERHGRPRDRGALGITHARSPSMAK